MTSLSSRDYLGLLDVVRELSVPCTLDEFASHVIALLPRLVRSERTAYNEVDLRRGRIVALIEPNEPTAEEIALWLKPHLNSHPLILHASRPGERAPRAISDFWSREAYHRSAIFNECFRQLGIEDQMALPFGPLEEDTLVAVTLNRGRRTFSARDHAVLELLRPHLTQAYRNAVATTHLQQEIALRGRLWDAMPCGAMLLRADGRIAFCSDVAARKLLLYLGPDALHGLRAPAVVLAWRRACRAEPLRAAPLPLTRGDSTLLVRLAGETPDGTLFLLEEHLAPDDTAHPDTDARETRALRDLGLTPRQSEVLLWLTRGARNEQIASRLELSPSTVKRHLEAIYAHLNVHTRNEAAHRAREVLREVAPRS